MPQINMPQKDDSESPLDMGLKGLQAVDSIYSLMSKRSSENRGEPKKKPSKVPDVPKVKNQDDLAYGANGAMGRRLNYSTKMS